MYYSVVRTFFSSISAALFVLAALACAFVVSMYLVFSDKDLYYEPAFVEMMVDAARMRIQGDPELREHLPLPEAEFQRLTADFVRPQEVAFIRDSLFEQIDQRFDSSGGMQLTFSTEWYHARVDALVAGVTEYYYTHLPRCEAAEVPFAESLGELTCIPPEMSEIELSVAVRYALGKALPSGGPREYVTELRVPSSSEMRLSSYLRYSFFALIGMIGMLVLLMLALMWLFMRKSRRMLLFFSGSFAVAGAMILLFALAFLVLMEPFVGVPFALYLAAHGVVLAVMSVITWRFWRNTINPVVL